MRRILAALLLAAMLLLTGCEFTSKVMCVTQSTSTSYRMTYAGFTGKETFTIRHEGGEALPVRVQVETEQGELGLTIARKDAEPAYAGNALPTGEFVVYLNEAGSYTVTVRGDDHAGGFTLDWSR